MSDAFEAIRRQRLSDLNSSPRDRDALAAAYGTVWTTDELRRDFEVLAFAAPYAVVRRRADGLIGSVLFQHHPRFFFAFQADEAAVTASCPWCHASNPADATTCASCGHDPHAPRADCCCRRCAAAPTPTGTITAADLDAALTRLRGRVARHDSNDGYAGPSPDE